MPLTMTPARQACMTKREPIFVKSPSKADLERMKLNDAVVRYDPEKCKCAYGCPTKDHASYAECLRSKGVGYAPTIFSSAQKHWDAELHAYKSATDQGIQPSGTSMKQINDAVEISQRTGKAFDAANVMESLNG